MLCSEIMSKELIFALQVDMDDYHVNQNLSYRLVGPPKTASGGAKRHVYANQMELFKSLRTR